MIKKFLFFLFLLSGIFSFSQGADTLDLLSCLKLARANAPVSAQFEVLDEAWQLRQDNIASTNLPSLSAFGKAWYQSDAITVTIPMPGIDGLSIDQFQYNLGLQVDQKIYDGRLGARQKSIESAKLEVNKSQTEINLYKVNDVVVQLYYSLLMMRKTSQVMEIKIENLEKRQEVLLSAYKNGMITQRELRKIDVEILNTDRRLSEIYLGINKVQEHLKILLGKQDQSDIFLSGQYSLSVIPEKKRPEYQLFDAQENQLELSKDLKSSMMLPKLYAFGQVGYSYPGLNFFENKDDAYYIVGARLGWTIFNWNQTRREKDLLETQKQTVAIQRKEFDRNLHVAESAASIEMEHLKGLMNTDTEILERRKEITHASASALENGTITTSDYLLDLNAEIASRIEYESHKIQYLQAEAKLLLLRGIGVE